MRRYMLAAVVGLTCVAVMGGATASAQTKRAASAKLAWMGATADKVQQGKDVRPDGKADGRFRLILDTEEKRKIVHVLLRSCDNRGVLTGRVAWDTDRARLWVLGVFRGGRALKVGRGRTIDRTRKGRTAYDLYASKPLGGFAPGSHYCAYVTFADGMGVSARSLVSAPVRAGLSYAGRDRDRVGRGNKAQPDGVKDAHFVLRMMTQRSVETRSITLTRIDARGRPIAGQVWDTEKNRNWVLGVERGRKRLNKRDRPIRDKWAGMTEYHLYASPRGALKSGQRFQVTVEFSSGGPSVAVVTLPKLDQAQATLAYVGLKQDRLGPRSPSGPDGKADGHFRLTVSKAAGKKITSLVLRAVWPGGAAVQGQIWDTRPRGYPMIAVYSKGKRLNPKDKGLPSQTLGASATYDLFIHNTGWVRPLQNFQVEVVFDGGDRIFAKAKVLKPRITGPIQLAMKYHGFTADKVGKWEKGGPDGNKDAQFTFTVDTGGRHLTVNKIELSVSDARGNTWRKTWDTQPGGHWILGVDKDGKRLNPRDKSIAHTISGRVTYTLWASLDHYQYRGKSYTYFTKGGYFTARLYLAGQGTKIVTIRLPR